MTVTSADYRVAFLESVAEKINGGYLYVPAGDFPPKPDIRLHKRGCRHCERRNGTSTQAVATLDQIAELLPCTKCDDR